MQFSSSIKQIKMDRLKLNKLFHKKEEEKKLLDQFNTASMLEFGSVGLVHVKTLVDDFQNFIRRGNVVDLAVGLVLGGAFTAIVNSFVKDIMTPFIGLVSAKNLENSFWVLKCPQNMTDCHSLTWTTKAAAHTAGAITVNWGSFVQVLLNFFINAIFIFILIKKVFSVLFAQEILAPKKCVYCLEFIKGAALKCKNCGSDVKDK